MSILWLGILYCDALQAPKWLSLSLFPFQASGFGGRNFKVCERRKYIPAFLIPHMEVTFKNISPLDIVTESGIPGRGPLYFPGLSSLFVFT